MLPLVLSDIPLTDSLLKRLVEATALGIEDLSELLHVTGISPAAFSVLSDEPEFQDRVSALKLQWTHLENAEERTRIKAGIAVEEMVIPLHALVHSPTCSPADRVRAAQVLRSLSPMQRTDIEARNTKDALPAGGVNNNFVLNIQFPWEGGGGGPAQVSIGRGPSPQAEKGSAEQALEFDSNPKTLEAA